MEPAVTHSVEFPAMRLEVMSALSSLSDRAYQDEHWGVVEAGVNFFDDLTLTVHTLYDDCAVLPDPAPRVGTVLLPTDVTGLVRVHGALGPLLAEHGDAPDSCFTSDPRWDTVIDAAREALRAMVLESE